MEQGAVAMKADDVLGHAAERVERGGGPLGRQPPTPASDEDGFAAFHRKMLGTRGPFSQHGIDGLPALFAKQEGHHRRGVNDGHGPPGRAPQPFLDVEDGNLHDVGGCR